MAKVGFIGLGNMGLPMAIRLVNAGHEVKGFDLHPEPGQQLLAAGGQSADDLFSAAEGADLVITMLPAGEQVKAVYLGEAGLINRVSKDALLVDCSTIDVASARDIATAAAAKGLLMLDAPVSGGVSGAEAASLTFMVGGPEEAFVKAEPYLARMGKKIVHCGDAGTGQAAKICNNMVLGISMIAVSEAFGLADRLGLDRQKLFDVASTSSGQCWSLTTYCPVPGPVPTSPANQDYQPGFASALMLKDLNLAQDAAGAVGLSTALGAKATALYRDQVEAGDGGLDFSSIFTFLK